MKLKVEVEYFDRFLLTLFDNDNCFLDWRFNGDAG